MLTNCFFFQYIVPFLVNQCGSLLYVFALGTTDLSLAVPVTNSLTFVFTAITGWLKGEEKAHRSKFKINKKLINSKKNKSFTFINGLFVDTYIGTLMILMGTTLCCVDKLSATKEVTS